MTDAFRRLLDQKIQEATKEMSKRLEQELLYGFPPKSELKGIGGMGELKDIISAAIDEHVPPQLQHQWGWGQVTVPVNKQVASVPFPADRFLKNTYKSQITDNIFREGPLTEALKQKGKKMTVVKDLRAEINHEKAVKRVTKALKKFEGSWLYKLKEGAHIGFDVAFEEVGYAYAYAAIFDGDRWHLTGARSPQKISTDDLVDWLIERNVKFKDVKLYKAVK